MDYGTNAAEPVSDVEDNVYEKLKKAFLEDLRINNGISEETIGQQSNNRWHEERRRRITASNFGRICKLRKTTPCSTTVKAKVWLHDTVLITKTLLSTSLKKYLI
ncbi:hypothetical protein ILUMI_14822 [Ignelater luminosus]|uniref:Uncharacterized protein n=1 Tax=Ignelater luminosus TaxID=2038154 RepID=A0A8K0CTI5_IGNLU|nr:hypothetical protein ILUMI_14822 [Ignelater luminosus]